MSDNTVQSDNSQTPPPPAQRKFSRFAAAKDWYTNPNSRKTAIIMTGVAAFAVTFGAYRILSGPDKPLPDQDQVSIANAKGAPGGNKGTKTYEKQLNQANQVMGAQAAKQGQTYMPTPTALHPVKVAPKQAMKKKAPAPAPVYRVQNPYTPNTSAPATPKAENTLQKSMMAELKKFYSDTPYSAVSVNDISKMPSSTATVNSAAMAALKPHTIVYSHPGYLTYAMLDSSINSNMPGPILATIESGKYRGARLLGSFKRVKQADILNFSEMTWKGHSYSIGAYAISPKNEELGLATSVNNHTLYRYGWLFAGAFLQGLSEAMQSSNSSTTVGNGFAVVSNELNSGQILEEAAGNVGNAIAPIAEARFNIPPTVRVAADTGLGILFMTPVKGDAQ